MITARAIAIIIFSGAHEFVHSKNPAISKKNSAAMFIDPLVDTRRVIAMEARVFVIPVWKKGSSSTRSKIIRKIPISIPNATISCCHVVFSSMPNAILNGAFRKFGRDTSFSRIFSVRLSAPPFNALTSSVVSFSAARIIGLTSRININTETSPLFMLS